MDSLEKESVNCMIRKVRLKMVVNIRNKKDLELMYSTLILCKEYARANGLRYNDMSMTKEVKRSIRLYRDRIEREKRERGLVSVIDKGYDDRYIELLKFPDYITTLEEAKKHFENWIKIEYRDRGYDCTGQPFTAWAKIFERSDGFYCYHCVVYDV